MRSSLKTTTFADLRERAEAMKAENPGMRARDAAEKLGCSEAEWVGCGAANPLVGQLNAARIQEWIAVLADSGRFMWLLRNEAAVLEVDAEAKMTADPGTVRIRAEHLEIDLDLVHCRYAFYTSAEKGPCRSVQIFDPSGVAVLKIYLKDRRRAESMDALLQPFYLKEADTQLTLEEAPAHPHEHKEGRTLETGACRTLLEAARDAGEAVTLEAENAWGHLKVTAVPNRLEVMGPWYNILDQGLNLHLREDLLASAFVVDYGETERAVFLSDEEQRYLSISYPVESRIAETLAK